MHTHSNEMHWRVLGVALCGALLAACSKTETASTVAPAEVATPAPVTAPEPVSAPQPAPPPAAAPAVLAAADPELGAMHTAQPSGKVGVPVDLHYQVDGDAMAGGPVTLHLAAVPRVAGANLSVSIKQQPGIQFGKGMLAAQKVTASTPYRQQYSLQRAADGPGEIRVLVTMDLPIGSGFTWFSVPLGPQPAQSKQTPDRVQ